MKKIMITTLLLFVTTIFADTQVLISCKTTEKLSKPGKYYTIEFSYTRNEQTGKIEAIEDNFNVVSVKPGNSYIESLNENISFGIRKNGNLLITGDSDGFFLSELELSKTSNYTSGEFRVRENSDDPDFNPTVKVICDVKSDLGKDFFSIPDFKKFSDDEQAAILGSVSESSSWNIDKLTSADKEKLTNITKNKLKSLDIGCNYPDETIPTHVKFAMKKLERIFDKEVKQRDSAETEDFGENGWGGNASVVVNLKNEIIGFSMQLNFGNGTDDYDDDSYQAVFFNEKMVKFFETEVERE